MEFSSRSSARAGQKDPPGRQKPLPAQPATCGIVFLRLLGLRFGKGRYVLLDIVDIIFERPQPVKFILEILELAMPSADSAIKRQWHPHLCFLPEPMPTFGLACAINLPLFDQGVVLSQERLKVSIMAYSNSPTTAPVGSRSRRLLVAG